MGDDVVKTLFLWYQISVDPWIFGVENIYRGSFLLSNLILDDRSSGGPIHVIRTLPSPVIPELFCLSKIDTCSRSHAWVAGRIHLVEECSYSRQVLYLASHMKMPWCIHSLRSASPAHVVPFELLIVGLISRQ
jgi:hypothetical protein